MNQYDSLELLVAAGWLLRLTGDGEQVVGTITHGSREIRVERSTIAGALEWLDDAAYAWILALVQKDADA